MGTDAPAAAAAGASINAKSPPAAVAALAAALVPTWAGLVPTSSSLEVKVISGGITNALWAVTMVDNPNISPRVVAVRAYGDGTELLVDRALEVETLLKLNSRGFGARVVSAFETGRVEEFLPGRALTPEETAKPETAGRIARGLARLHAVDLRKEKKKKALFSFFPCLFSSRRPQTPSSYSDKDSTLFPTIRQWIALADKLDAEAEEKTKKTPPPSPSVASAELLAEVALLEERVKSSCCSSSSSSSSSSCPELSRVVFCHMDLLPGNIMTTDSEEKEGEEKERGAEESPAAAAVAATAEDEKEKENFSGPGPNLQFIDFEYGRVCHAGFDVGNHWCEYAGLDGDWSRYPSAEQQKAFAKAYLSEAAAISSHSSPSSSPPPVSEEQVSAFVAQAELFSLAAHLFWTAWAKVQAHVSPIDFDYGSYARSRFEDYGRRRKGAGTSFAASS